MDGDVVFLSYAHDDEPVAMMVQKLAVLLRRPLQDRGCTLFLDSSSLSPGDAFTEEILDAIGRSVVAILMVSPAFFDSEYIQQVELPAILHQRDLGLLRICPVLVEPCLWRNYPYLHETLFANNVREPLVEIFDQRNRLSRSLADIAEGVLAACGPVTAMAANPWSGPAFRAEIPIEVGRSSDTCGAPDLPPRYWSRDEELRRLVHSLLLPSEHGACVVQLVGEGGLGKSVLASAAIRVGVIQDRYPDGIFWTKLSAGGSALDSLNELARLSGVTDTYSSVRQGYRDLKARLYSKRALIVIDDATSMDELSAVMVAGPSGGVLVTSRRPFNSIPSEIIQPQPLTPEACLAFLRSSGGVGALTASDLDDVVNLSAGLPLALTLGASTLRATGSVAEVVRLLRRDDFGDHPFANSFSAIGAASSALAADDLERLRQLVVFHPSARIPLATICAWFRHLYDDSPQATVECLGRVEALDLVTLDVPASGSGAVVIHDLVRAFLEFSLPEPLPFLHGELLRSYLPRGASRRDLHLIPVEEVYIWRHIAYHAREAGWPLSLSVASGSYLTKRIAVAGVESVIRDLDEASREPHAESLSADQLRRDLGRIAAVFRSGSADEVASTLLLWNTQLRTPLDLSDLAQGGRGHEFVAVSQLPIAALSQVISMVGHRGWVLCTKWAGKRRRVASGDSDGRILIWDSLSGLQLYALDGLNSPVFCLDAYAARLLAGLADGRLLSWSPEHGSTIEISGHSHAVRSIVVNHNSGQLFSGCEGGRLNCASLGDSGLTPEWGVQMPSGIRSLAISQDGSSLAVGGLDGSVHIASADGPGDAIRCPLTLDSEVVAVAFLGRSTSVLASSLNGQVVRWVDKGRDADLVRLPTSSVLSMSVSDDQDIVLGTQGGRIEVWPKGLAQAPSVPFMAHGSWCRSVDHAHHANSVVSGGDDGVVRLWDLERLDAPRKCDLSTQTGVRQLSLSEDDVLLSAACHDGFVRVWDTRTADLHAELDVQGELSGVAVCRLSQRAAAITRDGSVFLWSLADGGGSLIESLDRRHTDWPRVAAFSPLGDLLVTAGDDGTVDIYCSANLSILARIDIPGVRLRGICFDPTSPQRLLVGGSTGELFSIEDGENGWRVAARRRVAEGRIRSLRMSDDGEHALVGSANGSVHLVDWPECASATEFALNHGRVRGVAFVRGAKGFVAATSAGFIQYVRDPSNLITVRIGETLLCASMYRDGRRLAFATRDGVGLVALCPVTDKES